MEQPLTARHRWVAHALRAWRIASGLDTDEAAGRIGWRPSKLEAHEDATQPAEPFEIIAVAAALGINEGDRDRVVQLAHSASRSGDTWSCYAPEALSGGFKDFVIEESEAAEVRVVSTALIPDLLRTEDYAESFLRREDPGVCQPVLEERVRVLRQRQARLDDVRLHAIVYETALWNSVGGPSTMADQLGRLVARARTDNITVQIAAGDVDAARDAYQLAVDNYATAIAVYVEGTRGGVYLDDYDDVATRMCDFEWLSILALNPEESMRRILHATEDWARKRANPSGLR